MKKKSVPLRMTLTSVITAMIVVVAVLIFAIGYLGSTRSIQLLSDNMTNLASQSINEKIAALLGSAEKTNSEVVGMVTKGVVGLDDGKKIMNLLSNYALTNGSFSNVAFSNRLGNKYQAQLAPDASLVLRSYVRDDKQVTTTYTLANPSAENLKLFKNKTQDLVKGYDPRVRPWWKQAEAAEKTVWTDIYVSGASRQFVLTCATPFYDADHQLQGVASVDIDIISLSQFLGSLKIFDHGRAFIVDNKNHLIALPLHKESDLDLLVKPAPKDSAEPFLFYEPAELPDPTIKNSLALWLARPAQASTATYQIAGKNGATSFVHMEDFAFRPDSHYTIAIEVSAEDMYGAINRNSLIEALVAGFLILVAIAIGIALSRRISQSLAHLSEEVMKVSRLEFDSDNEVRSSISEVVEIDSSVTAMKQGLKSFKKYVPADLVRQLNDMRKEAVLGGDRKNLSIFFSDIADFTTISEQLSPEALVENLGSYFHGMSQTVLDHGGTVDKYIGDAIMAFWGSPVDRPNHAELACRSALRCQMFLEELAEDFKAEQKPVFHTRIGIHTGDVIVGNIGYAERMNYTIIGDSVNLASRLEGLNKFYGTKIIISDDTKAQAGEKFVTRNLDVVAVKGKSKGVSIHELVGEEAQVTPERRAWTHRYNQAMDLYLNQEWEKARQEFDALHSESPNGDRAAAILSQRCAQYLKTPPEEGWTGVYAFHEK